MSYIVPVHRPSGVRHAIKLNFTGPNDDTLIVAKANRLEIYTQTPTEGLTLQHSRSVYGYITMLSGLRPASSTTDHLFVGTDRYQYFTCSWDAETKHIKTEQSYVDQADKSLRDSKESDRCHIDPTGKYMSLELYDGVVNVVPIVQPSTKRVKRSSSAGNNASTVGALGDPVQIRIEQTITRDSGFLDADADSTTSPRLAILWEDNDSNPQLCLKELKQTAANDPSSLDLVTVAELRAELDLGVNQLIPVSAPYGGFLILGETSISYTDSMLKQLQVQRLNGDATIFTCWTKVDDIRWLLADDYGRLFFLMIELNDGKVSGWKLDALGEASRAACLVYLDEGVVFIGSHSGDSQVVRIVEKGVDVLQTFSNIAPILDFSIMDLGRGTESSQVGDFSSGQARVVAAAGAWQDGSIRSVRSGVGIEELGVIGEIPYITDMWAISSSTGSGDAQDALIVTSVSETRIFKFEGDGDVAEVDDYHHFEFSQATVFASNLPDNKVVQVHELGVQVTDVDSGMSVFQWRPPDSGSKITSAVANGAHLVVVQGGQKMFVFHISGSTISESTSKSFPVDSQVSSVTIPDSYSNVCIVAFWQTASVAILDLHSLEVVQSQMLGEPGRAVPRSVLVAQILPEASPTLLIAMADGTVVTFSFDLVKNTLSNTTRILLGTEPVFFKAIPATSPSGHKLTNVFASCEQPSLIYATEGRIIYSAVNTEKASRICPFSPEAYPGSVALATPTELKLALIGSTRTTQLQTLPIGETVRCLAYEPKAKVFGIGCVRRIIESGTEALMSSVKIADEVGFHELDSIELEDNELVECIISAGPLDDDSGVDEETALFVVGTSMLIEETASSTPEERGRIIIYRVDTKRNKLRIATEVRLKGACRSLAMCDGKIVAGLVKVVALYNLLPSKDRAGKYNYELKRLATYRTSTNPLSLHVQSSTPSRPATVAVGDLMKSISILNVIEPHESKSDNWQLKEICRHFATVWTSSVAGLAEHEWVLADMEGNLLMLRRNTEAVTPDELRRLEVIGEMRLGEVVNKIVTIDQPSSSSSAVSSSTGKGKERPRTISSISATASASQEQPASNSRASRNGPLIQPQAFIATVEGAIYMLGSIGASYIDALLRLQTALASRVHAPGYMPWARYRAFKTEVRESDEPFRFVDGEMVESGLLNLSNEELESVLREHGLMDPSSEGGLELSVDEVRSWGEQLRRLY